MITEYKKARFDYHLLEQFQAGLSLEGWEIKAIRQGRIQMNQAYIFIKDQEMYLTGVQIQPTSQASNHKAHDPNRSRKLLVSKKEIRYLLGKITQDGLTLVPTHLYWKGPWIKLSFSLAKGKKLHDKREAVKTKTIDRELQRIVKHQH